MTRSFRRKGCLGVQVVIRRSHSLHAGKAAGFPGRQGRDVARRKRGSLSITLSQHPALHHHAGYVARSFARWWLESLRRRCDGAVGQRRRRRIAFCGKRHHRRSRLGFATRNGERGVLTIQKDVGPPVLRYKLVENIVRAEPTPAGNPEAEAPGMEDAPLEVE
jgi:hypothetical protein